MSFFSRLRRRVAGGEAFLAGDEGFAFDGYTQNRVATRFVDGLSDEDLAELNQLLRWNCFTADAKGRRFGRRAAPGKREEPQAVPDPRIIDMDRRFGLQGKSVLEVGCFEGVHTVGLLMHGAQVTAVDSRVEHVVKTIVRTALFGHHATVFKCDVEDKPAVQQLPAVDLLHHVGVLYHLTDPVSHLQWLMPRVGGGVMLDTHYAEPEKATERYTAGGQDYAFMRYMEGGRREAFSGMYDHAKWLTLDALVALLRDLGFSSVEVVERRAERNGPRLRLFASR